MTIKISKWVKNTKEIGEIARYEQFLSFPQSFQNTFNCREVKTKACLGKGYLFHPWKAYIHIRLQDDKVLALSKVEAFADHNLNVTMSKHYICLP